MLWLQPLLLVPLAAEMFVTTVGGALLLIPVHLATFFVTALCCHQTLAASRPTAARSTEFYLWIAFGGALGGLFNVFLAPVLFRSVVEYPLGFVAAALLRPAPPCRHRRARPATTRSRRSRRDWPRSWRAASGRSGERPFTSAHGARAWHSPCCWPRPGAPCTPFAVGPVALAWVWRR